MLTMPDYAALRQAELRRIAQVIKDDRAYNRLLTNLYRRASEDITTTITSDIVGFSHREGVSMAEAKQLISSFDVDAYKSKAAKIVEEAKERRRLGLKVTPADYTAKVNKELMRYNVTMRTNRLELLQAKINLVITDLASNEEFMLSEKLFNSFNRELIRQAGILGTDLPSLAKVERVFKATILTDVEGVTFSDYIWSNQAELRDTVNQAIQRALIRGENPTVTARELRNLVKDGTVSASYAAQRIAVTETTRAQTMSQRLSYNEYGFTHFVFIAETDDRTCEDCEALDDGTPYLVRDMQEGVNAPPIHPNCRCSTAAHVVSGTEQQSEQDVDIGRSMATLNDMGRSPSIND